MTDEMIQLNFQTLQLEVQKMQTLVTQYAATFSDTDFMKNVPEYVTLKEAAKLKGVISYENLQKKPWHQPCCGTRSIRINGHRAWKRDEIFRWLKIDDSTLEEYARSLNVDISRHFINGKNRR